MSEKRLIPDFDTQTDPLGLFECWFDIAKAHEINDPNAMALASVDQEGMPDVRMVLLNGRDGGDFLFYTNMNSTKSQQLLAHSKAALCFHWKSVRAQIRIRGRTHRVSDVLADDYFATRHPQSRLGAHVSQQSQILDSRQTLMDKVAALGQQYGDKDIERPHHWSGFRLVPHSIEFWRDGDFRLHDRVQFLKQADGQWQAQRLYP